MGNEIMNKNSILVCVISVMSICAKKYEGADNIREYQDDTSARSYVILHNACSVLKVLADSINDKLQLIQDNYPIAYDALCLMIIMEKSAVYCGRYADILRQYDLIDESGRLKDPVDDILDARILDQNSVRPSPYAWYTRAIIIQDEYEGQM